MRLYLQIRKESDRHTAQQLEKLLASPSLSVPGIELVNTGPASSEVRYFHLEDKDEAEGLAVRLTAAGIPTHAKDSSGFAKLLTSNAPPKQIELWLAPDVQLTQP